MDSKVSIINLYVILTILLLGGCQKDLNGIGFQVDGGNEEAPKFESLTVKNISLKTDSRVAVTFDIKNEQSEDICLIKEIVDNNYSVFSELQIRLPIGKGIPVTSNGFKLTNYDKVKLRSGETRTNTLTFASLESKVSRKLRSVKYRLIIGGVYCSEINADYYPIDFILQSDWVSLEEF